MSDIPEKSASADTQEERVPLIKIGTRQEVTAWLVELLLEHRPDDDLKELMNMVPGIVDCIMDGTAIVSKGGKVTALKGGRDT